MKECDASVEQAGQESRRRQRGGAGIQKVRIGEKEEMKSSSLWLSVKQVMLCKTNVPALPERIPSNATTKRIDD